MAIKAKGSKFYTFRQNNTGGYFDIDERVTLYVIIEAFSSEEADDIAETKGLYFYGVDQSIDCECCGDRWYATSPYEGTDYPTANGEIVATGYDKETDTDNEYTGNMPLARSYPKYRWNKTGYPDVYIYYLNGDVEGVRLDAK